MKNKIIYWLPVIPLFGMIPMVLYPALNDEVSDRLCIKDSTNTVCCFIIQVFSVLVLLMELNIIVP